MKTRTIVIFIFLGILLSVFPGMDSGLHAQLHAQAASQAITLEKSAGRQAESHLQAESSSKYAGLALKQGLYSVAISLLKEKRNQSKPGSPEYHETTLRLMDAYINTGRIEAVDQLLEEEQSRVEATKETGKGYRSRYGLREALLAYLKQSPQVASRILDGIQSELLSAHERAWVSVIRGLVLETLGQHKQAQTLFRQALQQLSDPRERARVEAFLLRQKLHQGEPSKATLESLREQYLTYRGQSLGFTFAHDYIVALRQAGKQEKALKLLKREITLARERDASEEDHFLLLNALLLGLDSKQSSVVLKRLLEEGKVINLQRTSLELLLKQTAGNAEERKQLRVFLKDLLPKKDNPSNTHPLLEEITLTLGHLYYQANDLQSAESSALMLVEKYPGSIWKDEALKLLAFIGLQRQPPQYRTAADYFSRMMEHIPPIESTIIWKLLAADCYFLNGDYGRAADIYGVALETLKQGAREAEYALYQRVLAALKQNKPGVAREYLDAYSAGDNEQLSARYWKAEWNYVNYLRRQKSYKKALDLLKNDVQQQYSQMEALSRLRFMWLQARMYLLQGRLEGAAEICDSIIKKASKHEGKASSSSNRSQIKEVLDHAMLLKGQALLQLNQIKQAQSVFDDLKDRAPDGSVSLRATFDMAQHYARNGQLIKAQQNLVNLVDHHPNRRLAAVALYDAALLAEQQGLPRTYEEAISMLERLLNDYPAHKLAFFAALKQGDLLRELNKFGDARGRYESILKNFSDHPLTHEVKMSLAYAKLGQAEGDSERLSSAALAFERLHDLPDLPEELRIEAGYMWSEALSKADRVKRAKEIRWQVIAQFLINRDRDAPFTGKSAYWLARTIIVLAKQLEETGNWDEAQQLYTLLPEYGLPGRAIAKKHLRQAPTSKSKPPSE